ncbi:MAG: SDR family oxidoreductase, partial [Candidatus Limnocylindrales bacterium]
MGRVLIIGASGQVGRQLLAELARRHEHLDVVAASRSDPDATLRVELEHPETVERLIVAIRPDHVILAAGATNVVWCQAHPTASRTINVLGTAAAAAAAKNVDATLTFISTDYVFDGTDGPNGEEDATNPINVYGADKLAAETVVLAANPANLVIRTCQVFGADLRRTNFVLRTVDRLRRGETVEAAGDLFGTPTYAPDLARALIQLTLSRRTGIWHVAGERFLSRYELATAAAAAFTCKSGAIVEVSGDQMDDPVNR